jgi:DNA-directed RNA polymerase specialized sigma24 family protein
MYVAIRSEQEAWEVRELAEALFRQERQFLLAIAHRHAYNHADAMEAMNDAFAAFLRAYDPLGEAPPLPWFVLTLKRECWRKIRDAHLDRYVGQEVERGDDEMGSVMETLPARGSAVEDRVAEIDEARQRLAPLKPDERTAIGAFAAGYPYKEIAGRQDWTYTKVNRCMREGRAALAEAA